MTVHSLTANNDGSRTVMYRWDAFDKNGNPSNTNSMNGLSGGFFNRITIASDGSYAMDQDLAFGFGQNMARGGFMFRIPAHLSVGQSLPGGSVRQEYKIMSMDYKSELSYNNVTVVSEEDYETPAGTFHCYLISFSISGLYGKLPLDNIPVSLWLAPDIGIICYKYQFQNIVMYAELNELNR